VRARALESTSAAFRWASTMSLYPRLIVVGIAVLLAASWTAASANAAGLEAATTVVDTPNDGVIGPGDQLALTVKVTNDGTADTGPMQGTLTPLTAGAAVTQGAANYASVAVGASASNDTPFTATVNKSVVCGTTLKFNLKLTGGSTGPVDVPVDIDTGVGSTTFQSYEGSPVTVGNVQTQLRPRLAGEATVDVTAPGVIKEAQVTLGHLTHTNIGHLKLTLVGPDGTAAALVDHRGSAGGEFTDTQLSETGTMLSAGSSPYTGSFRADGDLGVFRNLNQAGRWRLQIDQDNAAESGRLSGWSLKIKAADCSPRSFVDLKVASAIPGAVQLDASGSRSATNSISKYEWDSGDGTGFHVAGDKITYPFGYGSHTVKVRVTDAGGVIDTVTKTFTANSPPTAQIAPVVGARQEKGVTLDGSGSTDAESPTLAKFEWDLDNNGTFTDANGPTPVVRFNTSGTHTIQLRVSDGDGATGTTSATFNVAPTFSPTAVVTATPNPVAAGALVTFDASQSSDSDGHVVAYDWDLDGNGIYETTGTLPTAARSYPNVGVVSVGLKLTDDDGRFTVTHIAVLVRSAGGGSGPGAPGAAPGGRTPTGGAGGGAGGGAADQPAQGALAASLAGSSIQTLKLISKKGLSLTCRADRAATCSVSATLPAAKARSLGLSKSRKKDFVLGRASVRLRKAGTATIKVRVSKRILARLRRVSRVSALVTGKAADGGGGRAVLRRVVLLRR
jgi:subtilisin-like proprotein convertase family protein